MGKTIKELADELHVSKTAIRKYMTPEFRAAHTENQSGKAIRIDADGCKLIAESFRKPLQTTANQEPQTTENQVSGDVVELLKATIDTLTAQLAVKDKQIAELTETIKAQATSLTAAQALHAGTMQQLLPSEGIEQVIQEEGKEKEETEAGRPRHWWQFWRRG